MEKSLEKTWALKILQSSPNCNLQPPVKLYLLGSIFFDVEVCRIICNVYLLMEGTCVDLILVRVGSC